MGWQEALEQLRQSEAKTGWFSMSVCHELVERGYAVFDDYDCDDCMGQVSLAGGGE